MPSRTVRVNSLELVKYSFPCITLSARVGSGTYVRSLARDIGATLGGLGVVTELRRTHLENLSLEEAISLDQVESSKSIPETRLFPEIEFFDLSENEFIKASHGMDIARTLSRDIGIGLYQGVSVGLFDHRDGVISVKRFGIS